MVQCMLPKQASACAAELTTEVGRQHGDNLLTDVQAPYEHWTLWPLSVPAGSLEYYLLSCGPPQV